MSTETDSNPVVEPAKPKDVRKEGILAWHDATTVEQKRALVTKYPFLREIYAEALHLT